MIETKEKPCKGTGIAKGSGCGKSTLYRKYGLCKEKCYPNWLLTTEEGRNKLNKARIRASKPRKELESARLSSKKNKTLQQLLVNTRTVCHEYIKKRDRGKPCISCQEPWHKDFQAGHFYKAELFSTLRFHEENIHAQCEGCNIYKEGNLNLYEINLEKRIGKQRMDRLRALAEYDKQSKYKWERRRLIQFRRLYKYKIKLL